MAYTNSSLVSYTKISPNKTVNRTHAIDTITIHCVVGQCSVETLGEIFYPSSRQASSNYGVGKDGRIGMYVEEKDRSWCSSNAANDHRAITIEVASDTTEPYAVNDTAYAATIDLVTDICKRNGISRLVWSTDKNTRVNHLNGCNMTVHRDYANKSCPGTYLYNRMGEIAAAVNAKLGATETSSTGNTENSSYTAGTKVTLSRTALYASSTAKTKSSTKTGTFYLWSGEVVNGRIRVTNSTANVGKSGQVTGWVDVSDLGLAASGTETSASSGSGMTDADCPFFVKVSISDLNIRSGPGTNYARTGKFTGRGVFTIMQVKSGTGSDKGWGKLKSGAGWISLDFCTRI